MKFQYISDIHLEKVITKMPTIIKPNPTVPLFLAGDIGDVNKPNYGSFLSMASNNWKHVFMVTGNHEYNNLQTEEQFQATDWKIQQMVDRIGNITFLNRKSVCYDDYLIIGTTLWTHTPLPCKDRIITENTRHSVDRAFIHDNIHLAITMKLKPFIMTHHVPSYKLILPSYSGSRRYARILFRWASDSDDLVRLPVETWICGHTHASVDTHLNGVRVLINAATRMIKENR